jgi:hypothetical protein
MPRQSKEFYPQAARRLLLAVINQAISDVLENEGEAEAAEQWLSSRDFDSFWNRSPVVLKCFITGWRTLSGA